MIFIKPKCSQIPKSIKSSETKRPTKTTHLPFPADVRLVSRKWKTNSLCFFFHAWLAGQIWHDTISATQCVHCSGHIMTFMLLRTKWPFCSKMSQTPRLDFIKYMRSFVKTFSLLTKSGDAVVHPFLRISRIWRGFTNTQKSLHCCKMQKICAHTLPPPKKKKCANRNKYETEA